MDVIVKLAVDVWEAAGVGVAEGVFHRVDEGEGESVDVPEYV